MLFWFGLLVALVAGLLSIWFSPEAVKRRFPIVGDYHRDVAAVVLLIFFFGLALSAVEHYRSERSFRKLVLTSGASSSPAPTAKPTATGAAFPKAVSLDQAFVRPAGADQPKKEVVYIFGYGSLINPDSRARTGVSGEAIPVEVTGLERRWSSVRCKLSERTFETWRIAGVPPEVLKTLEKWKGHKFASRAEWLKILTPILKEHEAALKERNLDGANFLDPLLKATTLGVDRKEGAVTNGVVVAIPKTAIDAFDRREDGYKRVRLAEVKAQAVPLYGKQLPEAPIEVYVPDDRCEPQADCPIIQTYVDVVMAGAILQFGEGFAQRLVETTKGWEYDWVDDRHRPVYSRAAPYYDLAKRIDVILAEHVPKALPKDKKARRVFQCP
jgi:cation transport regulator ChaC